MSAPKPNGASKPSTPTQELPRIFDGDIALLTSLVGHDDPEGAELDVAELLRRMDTADGVARDVERWLDEIIGHLDDLLGSLQSTEAGSAGQDQSAEAASDGKADGAAHDGE